MGSEWSRSARVNSVCLGDVCAAASVCLGLGSRETRFYLEA